MRLSCKTYSSLWLHLNKRTSGFSRNNSGSQRNRYLQNNVHICFDLANEFQIDLLLNTFVKRSYAYISLWHNTELVVVCINKITPQCKTEARSGDLHVDCDNLEKRHIKLNKKTFNFLLIVKYFCDKFKWWHKGINFTDRLKLLKNCWSFLMVWHLKELSWNESLWVKVHKHGNE